MKLPECKHEFVADVKEMEVSNGMRTFMATRVYCRLCGLRCTASGEINSARYGVGAGGIG